MASVQGGKAADGMGMGEMLSLFAMFCGGFMLAIGLWLYVASTSASHGTPAAPTERTSTSSTNEYIEASERSEKKSRQLRDEMQGALDKKDNARVKVIREDQRALHDEQIEQVEGFFESREEMEAQADAPPKPRRIELSEDDKHTREMGNWLSLLGGGLLCLGTCGFIFIRLRS